MITINYIEKIDELTANLNQDQKKFLYLDHLKSLIKKIVKNDHHEFDEDLEKLMQLLKTVGEDYQRDTRKKYIKNYQQIKGKARKKYGYVQKGVAFGENMAIFFPFGVAFVIIFDNLALGIGFGLLAASIVSMLAEKNAEKKGLIY